MELPIVTVPEPVLNTAVVPEAQPVFAEPEEFVQLVAVPFHVPVPPVTAPVAVVFGPSQYCSVVEGTPVTMRSIWFGTEV